jgi:hypothetical protein
MAPARPLVAVPVCSAIQPELPCTVTPVERKMLPVAPNDDATAVRITTDPEPELSVELVMTFTTPPVAWVVDAPAVI